MSEAIGMDEFGFSGLLASVMQERRAMAEAPAGMEQRLMARLAQEETKAVTGRGVFAGGLRAQRSSRSLWIAIGAHGLALTMILLVVSVHREVTLPKRVAVSVLLEPKFVLPAPPRAEAMGGGGGHADPAPASQGRLPKFAKEQVVPLTAPPMEAPRLAVEPTIVMQKDLKMAQSTLPNLGMPSASAKGISLGDGVGGGIGPGNGSGIGTGSGGNTGGRLYHIGGEISKPVVLVEAEAEYSEAARKAKFSGDVEVYLWVDAQGNPSHVRVVRGVGMGLDEKAIEAVRKYKFKPAMKNGEPVTVDMYIDVNFQIL